MDTNRYVIESINLHLFFGRIMKEHALFLQAGFTPADPAFSAKAGFFLDKFETLLCDAVSLANGVVSQEVLESGEVVTEFTALAEKQTECFTGIRINNEITSRTRSLKPGDRKCGNFAQIQGEVHRLNCRAIKLLDGMIRFKESILKSVLQGQMFTLNYTLLIEHILREAKLYRRFVQKLEREGDISEQCMKENECFWNQIMMEHAMFIRGLLDPCETELFCSADGFADAFCELLDASQKAQNKTLTEETLAQAIKFRDFKSAGTQGILQSKIRSTILPLLADHVLREANHYIRLLQC